jgi:hypothetical protein
MTLYLELLPPDVRKMTRVYLNGRRAAFWHGPHSNEYRLDQLLEQPTLINALAEEQLHIANGFDSLWGLKCYFERLWYEKPLESERSSLEREQDEAVEEEERKKKLEKEKQMEENDMVY